VNIVVRVDASRQIGVGHLVRCLTLADALRVRGARCRFVCRHVPDTFAATILSRGHELERLRASGGSGSHQGRPVTESWLGVGQEEDARQTLAALGGRRCDWLVVDHYALDLDWESKLRSATRHILAIDDLADRKHDCDVLLDQNLYLDADTRYAGQVPGHCRLLLGPRYALLREEFREERLHAKPRSGPVRRILVFFGGVDATNRTSFAIEALTQLDLREIHVDIVIGAEHPNRDEIEAVCRARQFALHVQTGRMAELMTSADLGIGAGGSATWERCCVGLPCVAASIASNQDRLVHDAALAGALYAPEGALADADELALHVRSLIENQLLRQSISCNGMKIVDGRGTNRVLCALGVVLISIRPAVPEDASNLFAWRNHPAIRQVSRSTSPLDWSTHNRWLESILGDPARVLLIGETAGHPVGVVRFDTAGHTAEVSIYTVPGHDQRGMGADLLSAAETWLSRNRSDIEHLNAEVLGGNPPSHSLFSGAGYQLRSAVYTKRMK
jgi:UDP-2,4-diacetamido-2,4,6-trideoxy-beta-L-altropyranose hydrolase